MVKLSADDFSKAMNSTKFYKWIGSKKKWFIEQQFVSANTDIEQKEKPPLLVLFVRQNNKQDFVKKSKKKMTKISGAGCKQKFPFPHTCLLGLWTD